MSSKGEKLGTMKRELVFQLMVLGILLGLMWGLEVFDYVFGAANLDQYGVKPRSIGGLKGVLTMPFLHGGFDHLISNSLPFLVLGWLILLRGPKDFFFVFFVTAAAGALLPWLIGSGNSVHIGASGVVFGFLGFLLAAGVFERKVSSIAVALLVGFVYGGVLWGVLPNNPGISWEGHMGGFVGGAWFAWWMSRKKQPATTAA